MAQYWVVVFTGKTWDEFIADGASELGFRERRRLTVDRMVEGDKLMCYVSGVARWIGELEVAGKPVDAKRRIFSDEAFPVRIPVKLVTKLEPETSVVMADILRQFSWWDESKANRWGVRFQYPPSVMTEADGKLVENALVKAARNPHPVAVEAAKWSAKPRLRK